MTSPPLYHRLLRLRHVRPRPATTFLLFEGSIALGLLLGLSEIVSPWGVVVLPATVAIMVKLNDVIAGSLARPLALAQLQAPRILDRVAVGRSPVLGTSHPTTWITADDAVPDPRAYPDPAGPGAGLRAIGVAPLPSTASGRRPAPGARTPESEVPALAVEHPAALAHAAGSSRRRDASSSGRHGRASHVKGAAGGGAAPAGGLHGATAAGSGDGGIGEGGASEGGSGAPGSGSAGTRNMRWPSGG